MMTLSPDTEFDEMPIMKGLSKLDGICWGEVFQTSPMSGCGLVLEDDHEDTGPWSPDPRIDRYLAPLRRERIEKRNLDFLRQSAREHRAKYPPWWMRLWNAIVDRWFRWLGLRRNRLFPLQKPPVTEIVHNLLQRHRGRTRIDNKSL